VRTLEHGRRWRQRECPRRGVREIGTTEEHSRVSNAFIRQTQIRGRRPADIGAEQEVNVLGHACECRPARERRIICRTRPVRRAQSKVELDITRR
jgi:hypothetical protein